MVNISKIIPHPKYLQFGTDEFPINDVALVKLVEPLKIDPTTNPDLGTICLPPQNEALDVVGKVAIAIGWGLTKEDIEESWSRVLMKVSLPVAPIKECQDLYKLPEEYGNTYFCTVTKDGKDACQVKLQILLLFGYFYVFIFRVTLVVHLC